MWLDSHSWVDMDWWVYTMTIPSLISVDHEIRDWSVSFSLTVVGRTSSRSFSWRSRVSSAIFGAKKPVKTHGVSMVPWQALIDDAMKDLPIGTGEAKRCQDRIIRLGWGLSFPTLKLWRQAVRREVPRCLGAVQKFGFSGCGMLETWIFRLILVHDKSYSQKWRRGHFGVGKCWKQNPCFKKI